MAHSSTQEGGRSSMSPHIIAEILIGKNPHSIGRVISTVKAVVAIRER